MKTVLELASLIVACLFIVTAEARGQCTTSSCNPDDIFVGNFGGASDLVRFSKADIALNGNAATSIIIASGFGSAEGLANDFDGTVIVTTRFTGNVERVCRDGSQRAIEANVNLAEGPSFAANGDLFLNDTGPTGITYKAPPGVPFAGLAFVPWVNIHPAGTFLEDTRIAPAASPLFPGELFIMRSTPGLTFNPNKIEAFSASIPNTFLGAVVADFGTAAGLANGSYTSLGMAFDSQGDLWVTKWTGPVGSELLEFSAAANYAFSRAVPIVRPGNIPIFNSTLVKMCITPPDPNDPLNPGNDTLFVADFGGFLHVVDEVTGATLASPNSNLVTPAGVACCDVVVGGEPRCVRTQGFWKNHPDDWPVEELTLGTVNYNQAQLLRILRRPVKGNGLVSLAKQLIAAKLNKASGAPVPQPVQDAMDGADALIDGLVVPPIGEDFLRPSVTEPFYEVLDEYNNGTFPDGPPSCDELEEEE